MKDFWSDWQFTSWNQLCKQLTNIISIPPVYPGIVDDGQGSIQGHWSKLPSTSSGNHHCGIWTIATTWHDKSYQSSVESWMSLSWITGTLVIWLVFCRKWQNNMRSVGLEVSDEEVKCLFLGVDPKGSLVDSTVNISVDSPMPKFVKNWEPKYGQDPQQAGACRHLLSSPITIKA